MVLSVKEKYVFTPKFNGNDKLPAAERFTCEIIRPSPDEEADLTDLELVRDFSKKEVAEVKGSQRVEEEKPKKASVRFIRRQDTGRILRDHVGKCWNLSEEVEDDKGKKTRRAVNSGADLAESKAFGIRGLIDELCAEVLRDKLSEDDEKNSESASSST